MPLALSLAFAVAAAAAPSLPLCSWDQPSQRAFVGDVVAAVDRYGDIPAATRQRFKARMRASQYDDRVLITRDTITGRNRYGAELREMHVAQGEVCARVTRRNWTPSMAESGLVYCDGNHCLVVPIEHHNLARLTRQPDAPARAEPVSTENAAPTPASSKALSARATPDRAAGANAGTAVKGLVGTVAGESPVGGATAGSPGAGATRDAANSLPAVPPLAGAASVAGLPAASFEQLSPADLARSLAALAPSPSSTAPAAKAGEKAGEKAQEKSNDTERVSAGGTAANASPAPTPWRTLDAPTSVSAGSASAPPAAAVEWAPDWGQVLPVLAWTTPFGHGPAPWLPGLVSAAPPQPVPEPHPGWLWLAGAAWLMLRARKRIH